MEALGSDSRCGARYRTARSRGPGSDVSFSKAEPQAPTRPTSTRLFLQRRGALRGFGVDIRRDFS